MKKKIALLLSLMLLITALLPVGVFAADDMGLEAAIKAVREKLTIPENFTLNYYNSNTENGKKVWNLDWNAKDGDEGNMSASVDESGNITRYYQYEYNDYNQRKLPKISREDAKAVAEDFIDRMNPDIASQLGFKDNYVPSLMDNTYNFHFYRKVDDVAFYSNYVSVEINRQSGNVTGFYTNWQDDLAFPDKEDIISLEQAQSAYMEKLGLRLVYNYTMENDKINTYAVYVPKYNDSFIDAFTGEKVNLSYGGYYRGYDGTGGMGGMNENKMSFSSAQVTEIRLTPDEEEAVRETSGLMDKSEVEKIARETEAFGLTEEFTLDNDSLYRDWNDKSSFTWNLSFVKKPVDENDQYRSVSVSLDAKTGEIKGFYLSEPREQGATALYDEAASKEAVEAFLKELQPVKFSQTEYDDSYRNDYLPLSDSEMPLEYGFRYVRKVGDAIFPSNSIYVRYDAVSGKVTSFELSWFSTTFESLASVMPVEDVYEKLFAEIGLELQYQLDYSYEYYLKYAGVSEVTKPEVKLVYTLNPDKPAIFDADTGEILSYNGKPFTQFKPAEYTDIAGNMFENQIKLLAENGIALAGTEFKPDENIKQKDFFLLLSKVLINYWYEPSMPEDEQVEQLYSFLAREGIIKDGEKAPTADVTREDAVKFIIRALKYDEVADIKSIFKCEFKDVASINPDLIGYVAIAAGLDIISGDANANFKPKNLLSRAETVVLICNYLQR